MQKSLCRILLLLVLLAGMACNRKLVGNNNAALLAGTWELRLVQAGMMPARQPVEGNGNAYTFTGSRYEQYSNGVLENSGTYRVEKDNTVQKEVGLQLPAGEFTHRIIFNDDTTAAKTFFHITGDQLVLLSGYFPTDGGSRYTYQKIAAKQ